VLTARSQHQRILPPARRRVVAAAPRDPLESVALVQGLTGPVARAHLEEHLPRAELARERHGRAEERRAVAAALPARGDREVEQVRLARRDHEHEVADQLAADAQRAAGIARAQRVREVAARPGMAVDGLLDREHLVEVRLAHRRELRLLLEHCAHRRRRSSVVSATLSRR
jgi:hypothetical protein